MLYIVCHDLTNFEILILRGHSITTWTLSGGGGKLKVHAWSREQREGIV